VDTVANNLANVNTIGFKRGRLHFQDLFYQRLSTGGGPLAAGQPAPSAVEVGHGAIPVSADRVFSQGETRATEGPLDLLIEGEGFFTLLMPDGTPTYTRDGCFTLNADGVLVSASGLPVEPSITLPDNVEEVTVSPDGVVSAVVAGSTTPQEVGTLELARFVNPAGLRGEGHNLYSVTEASGPAITGTAGTEGMGRVISGYLEMSNVSVVEEMVNLISAQRAYEINSKAIQSADEMLSLANNLRR